MAFAIGELIGGFIAALFIPLFLFYFAGMKGRSMRTGIVLRSLAVLVAVFAVVAEALGSGGQFPTGAVLAVLVCFVWATRASLRDRGRGLNGWQRLGVILSAIWLPVGFFWGNAWWISENGTPAVDMLQACEETQTTLAELNKCTAYFNSSYTAAIAGHWWAGLAVAVGVLLFTWGLAWGSNRLYRWVRAGFAPTQA